ncbi:MAG: polysaccharide biosynthesis tyrosine autokinase [Proteobacteria bacterium]|nr:polysaccharide biosynthesis tyrosine autokinase [Pseudomonadota bacterium]MBU1688210.1 polysaccharide biosynthesis tyrosine autokinase [Pseudomonadota bacterium]
MSMQTAPGLTSSPQEEEIHLRDYLRVIRKRRNSVILFACLTFTVVLVATFFATPIFEAKTKILINRTSEDNLSQGVQRIYYDPTFDGTQTELIKSFNVAYRVVRTLKLDDPTLLEAGDTDSPLTSLKKKIRGLLQRTEAAESGTLHDQQAALIMDNITVKPVKDSQIFEISYLNKNPQLAKDVANAVAKAYMDEVLEIKMHSVGYTLQWMTEKAGEEKDKLEASERQLQQYMADSNVVTLQDKIAILPEKMSEFSTKLSEAVTRLNELQEIQRKLDQAGLNYDKVDAVLDLSTQSALIKTLFQQLIDAQQKQTELSKKYGPKHPRLINITSEMNTIESNLEREKTKEMTRQIKLLNNKLDLARSQVKNLQENVDLTKNEAQQFNQKMIQYGILKRDVETNRVLYESLLTQIKEKKVTEQTSNINIWVTEAAKTPGSPAKPKKARNILLGLILGLFGGVGLAFFLEYLDNTIGSPDDAEARLGVSVLGIIDRFNQENMAPDAAEATADFSTFAEGFKSIRTAILLSAADRPPKKILVTSMLPQEGKTTTTVNLARTFAQANYKVVIIDADLRKPRVHKVFGTVNDKGLSTYLAGVKGGDIIKPVVNEPNLKVIPAGPIPPNPSELLVSDRFKKLLEALEQKYDFIFIDSAPLFSATETLLLSQATDGTLMVGKAGQSTYEILSTGIKALHDSGAHVLGLVINELDRDRAGYGYGSYYGGRYYKYASYYSEDVSEE